MNSKYFQQEKIFQLFSVAGRKARRYSTGDLRVHYGLSAIDHTAKLATLTPTSQLYLKINYFNRTNITLSNITLTVIPTTNIL